VSTPKSKKKAEELPVASEATPVINEHGKRLRVEDELIDSTPEDPSALLQYLIYLLLKQAIVSRAHRESDAARQFLASLSGSFGDLDFTNLSDANLHSLLNVHRNEYLGNLSKTQVYHARAMQALRVADSLAKLLKARRETAMIVDGVRDLALQPSSQSAVNSTQM
jgi:hypothetical protein